EAEGKLITSCSTIKGELGRGFLLWSAPVATYERFDSINSGVGRAANGIYCNAPSLTISNLFCCSRVAIGLRIMRLSSLATIEYSESSLVQFARICRSVWP